VKCVASIFSVEELAKKEASVKGGFDDFQRSKRCHIPQDGSFYSNLLRFDKENYF
jgi:hypothetical protein